MFAKWLTVVTALLAAAACGGGGSRDAGSPDAGGSADAGTTTETWSGAHTATLTAGPPVAQWTVATDRSEVSQIIDNGTELSEFSFFFPGKPMTTNYVGVDGGVNCTVLASLKANLDGWLANHNNAAAPDLGECSLTLTSVTEKADVGSQKKYTVHGSVAAVLPARSGAATGTVNFAASF